ncbi:EAL domain-containing protein [Temperatibacter marinus]|uniref:EAL domain-containing protein n=1 Tax=Temperatibacter marinus TaxID=1456591 RepID=A0AA52ECY8_9PROT|nr:EAL domain-containing protein [Temperatibacter marinus]WND02476.1 EAL domain-containing protein [Temperatibacter marinus]
MPHSSEFSISVTETHLLDPSDGRLSKILGWEEYDLFRQPVEFLFPPDAHSRLQKLLAAERKLDHVVFPKVPLRYHAGGYINFDMQITSNDDGSWLFEFFKVAKGSGQPTPSAEHIPAQEIYAFFDFVQAVLESPYEGDLDMAMIQVSGLREGAGLSPDQREKVRDTVEEELKNQAIGGRIGQVDEATYSLLTGGDFHEELFHEEVENAAKSLGLSLEELGVKSRTVAIDDPTLPADQMQKALSQATFAFSGHIDDMADARSITEVVSGIEHHVNLIKAALNAYGYRIGKRQASYAVAGQKFAFLLEGKVDIDGHFRRPDELINLVDHADLALEHDLKQIEEVLRQLAVQKDSSQDKIFYDLCRSCLLVPDFHERLNDLLEKYLIMPSQIGLRIMGVPPIKRGGPHWQTIKRIRKKGILLWTDRFGDAVTDEELAPLLKEGVIEMPASLLKKLISHFDGKDLITQLVKVWQSKSVWVVLENIEDEKWKRQALEAGIEIYLSRDPYTD